jgi:DNA polymerase III delta prime subunit
MGIQNTKWTEKYRPKTLDGYVGNPDLISKVKHWIEIQDVPDLFLHGPAGTGKTTLAKIIANALDADVHYINASSENGIDVLRERITAIVDTVSFSDWIRFALAFARSITSAVSEAPSNSSLIRPAVSGGNGDSISSCGFFRFAFTGFLGLSGVPPREANSGPVMKDTSGLRLICVQSAPERI